MRIRRFRLALSGALVLVLAVLGTAVWVFRSTGRAERSGEIRLGGLKGPVTVRWDRWGMPAVEAGDLEDLIAVQGYLHAGDRFTQMELGRRAAAGRLSELVGPRALPLDRHFRTLRLASTAERLWGAAGTESRRLLEAYARGVNGWIQGHGKDLPPGLRLLGDHPEPWRPQDSLGFVLLMANDLSFWQGRPEEERFLWLRAFGPERTRDLVGEPDLDVPAGTLALAEETPAPTGAPPEAAGDASPGSNNWALGGSRTASGSPLVANDPHLALRLPGTWYQMLLRSPSYEVSGMTLPGVPGVVIGRNRDLAWAFTNTMLDDHDLFLERLDESDPDRPRVERDGKWVAVAVRHEKIAVRGGDPVDLHLSSTDRGPLLPAERRRGLPPRSLAWTMYIVGDPLSAFLALGRAGSVEEALAGIDGYVGPAQNLVMADRTGSLVYTVLGRVPVRRKGNGRLPAPGWDPAYGWDGLRSQTDNPLVTHPADDLLVTANDDEVPAGYPYPLTADFDTPYRAQRIRQLVGARDGWKPAEMAEVQDDVDSLYARQVVSLLARDEHTGDAGRAMAALAGWDGTMRGGRAALFALVEEALKEAIFGDEASAHGLTPFGSRERLVRILTGEMSPAWFDDVATPPVEGRRATVDKALATAFAEGSRRWGDRVEDWPYGEIHPLTLVHPLGAAPLVGRFFNRGPFPMPGSATTVAAFGGRFHDGRQPVTYGPSMRWATDVGDPDGTFSVLPGGQAGHPADPHYDDQLPLYLRGELHPVPWSEAAVEKAAVSRLTFRP